MTLRKSALTSRASRNWKQLLASLARQPPSTGQSVVILSARFLKAELKRAGVTYEELAERLKKHGQGKTKASIANKLSRGTFSAVFFLATLAALGFTNIPLEDV
jgi:hypothetical protein